MLVENLMINKIGESLILTDKLMKTVFDTYEKNPSYTTSSLQQFKVDIKNNIIWIHYYYSGAINSYTHMIECVEIVETVNTDGQKTFKFNKKFAKNMKTISDTGKNRSYINDLDLMSDGSIVGLSKSNSADTNGQTYSGYLFKITAAGIYSEKKVTSTNGTQEYFYGHLFTHDSFIQNFCFVNPANDDVLIYMHSTNVAVNSLEPEYYASQIIRFDKNFNMIEVSRPYPGTISFRFLAGTGKNIKSAVLDKTSNSIIFMADTDLTLISIKLGKINESTSEEFDRYYPGITFTTDTYFVSDPITGRCFTFKRNSDQLFSLNQYLTPLERVSEKSTINMANEVFFYSDLDDCVYTYTRNLINGNIEVRIMSASNEDFYIDQSVLTIVPNYSVLVPKLGTRIPNGITSSTLVYPRSSSELHANNPTFIYEVGVTKFSYSTQQFRLVIDTDRNKILNGLFDDTYLIAIDSYASGLNFNTSINWQYSSDYDPYLGLITTNGTWNILGTGDGKVVGGTEPTNGIKTSLNSRKFVKVTLSDNKILPEINKTYYFRLLSYSKK